MLQSKGEKIGFAVFLAIVAIMAVMAFMSEANAETYQWSKGYTANCTDTISRVGYDPADSTTDHLLLDPVNVPGDVIDHVMYYVTESEGPDISTANIIIKMIDGCQSVKVNTKVLTPGVMYYKHAVTYLADLGESAVSDELRSFDVKKANPNAPGNIQ